MKRNIIILLITLLLSLAVASAASYEYEIIPVKNVLESGESAQFVISITNNNKDIREFKIYSNELEWNVPSEIIKAYPETDTVHKLVISPLKYVEPGIKGIILNIKDVKTNKIVHTDVLEINVKSNEGAVSSYKPSIRISNEVPSTINPKEGFLLKVKLDNQNLLNLENLTLKISGDVEEFNVEQNVAINSLEKKEVEISYELNPLLPPKDYKLNIQVLNNNKEIAKAVEVINVIATSENFKEEEAESSFLFKNKITNMITSESNIKTTKIVKTPTNLIKNMFTSTSIKSKTVKEEGQRYIITEVELNPGETKWLTIVTNYRIILYLIILAIILLLIHQRYKSPIIIRKVISDVNMKEGGISDLKITLELVNKGTKSIKNVIVTDYIPNIANIEKEFLMGTLKPNKIFKHKTKGTVIKWELDEVVGGEDRLISYNIKSQLSVVGDFKMPRAKLVFKKDKREIISYSNQIGVSS